MTLANGWRPDTADATPDAKALAADARRGDPPAVTAFARAAALALTEIS